MEVQAHRIDKFEDLDDTKYCYFKADGIWYLYMPGCGLGSLAGHQIVEHENGTITVTPSILTTGHHNGKQVEKHGYLTNGIWRDC
jgi:hypothetical protein